MHETRIIFVGIDRLLGDLLEKAIEGRSDMTLVADIADENAVATCVRKHAADIVIFNLAAERLLEVCGPLLRSFPNLVAISIFDRDRLLLRCELVPQVLPSGEASIDRLITMIRRLHRRRRP